MEDVLGPHVFVVGGDDPVVVIHAAIEPPARGASVTVSGHIDSFDPERLAAELDVSFDPSDVAFLVGRRCIVATAVDARNVGPART